MIHQGDRIAGVVRHRPRCGGDLGEPKPALVVGGEVEVRTEHVDRRLGALERGAGAVDEKQARAGAAALEMDVDAVEAFGGHGAIVNGWLRPDRRRPALPVAHRPEH